MQRNRIETGRGRKIALGLLLGGILVGTSVGAESPDRPSLIPTIDELSSRLNLTSEQRATVQPALETMKESCPSDGEGGARLQQGRHHDVPSFMAPRRTFLEAVVPVLEPEQVEELAQMINERRDAYREEHRKRDGSGPGHGDRAGGRGDRPRGDRGKKGGQRAERAVEREERMAERAEGFAARREEHVAFLTKALSLNPKQVATMTETLSRIDAERKAAFEEARKNDFDRGSMHEKMEQMRSETLTELQKGLDSDQARKLAALETMVPRGGSEGPRPRR